MKVEHIKLGETAVEFYNNNIIEMNFKCFENMICKILLEYSKRLV